MLPYVCELIIVEGIHDERAIKQTVNATVLCLGGWAGVRKIMGAALKNMEATGKGILFFLDSDETGSLLEARLRQFLKTPEKALSALLEENLCTKGKKVGVEHARKEDILKSLQKAGATFLSHPPRASLTHEDLQSLKLKDSPLSRLYRQLVTQHFSLPQLSAKRLLELLNFLETTPQELQAILDNKDPSLKELAPKHTS